MPAFESTLRDQVTWVNVDWPLAEEEHGLPEEPWLPARDVSLLTLAAFALLAVLQLLQ